MTILSRLNELHVKQKAKLVDFAGYKLPIWFSSMKDEHLAVRNSCGIFDISHMGLFKISGEKAFEFMQKLSCNDASRSLDQKMIYSMFLNEDGMILDDVMFAKNEDYFHLIVNGANCEKISAWMNKQNTESVTIDHLNNRFSLIAVQGPEAETILTNTFEIDLADVAAFSVKTIKISGHDVVLSRTGYTGEDGFELMIEHESVESVWQQLLDAGASPCGLAARDSLRIEYGLPLYGQELSESIHPFMTRYSWVVKFNHDFLGKEALTILKEQSELKAVALELDGKLIARNGYPIKEGGYISSGTFSPVTNKSIALGFLPVDISSLGQSVTVLIRKNETKATVVKAPFLTD